MHDISLKTTALTGSRAMMLDLVVITLCLSIVVIIANIDQEGHSTTVLLTIPLAVMFAGVLGVLVASKQACGFLFNFRYIVVYLCTIGLMIGVDMLVCEWLGGSKLIVLRNWALLIGSASCVNIFFLKLHKKISTSNVAQVEPLILACVVSLQITQMFISVLGMTWFAALAQIVARRIILLPITHIIAKLNYGDSVEKLDQNNQTIEYVAVQAMTDVSGNVKEKDLGDVTIAGTMLLKLPIFGGRFIKLSRKSWVTLIDELIFLEQILAFSSPTMVVSPHMAILQMSYVWKVTTAEGHKQTPLSANRDRLACKHLLRHFILGKRREYVANL